MPLALEVFQRIGLSEGLLDALLAEHDAAVENDLNPLWAYYRNETARAAPGVRGRLAQEAGLPARITGAAGLSLSLDDRANAREIVIENDIAWRLHTMVDFMFGKPVQILSTSNDESQRRPIERTLDAVWEASGGIALLQDIALIGHVYGYVDLLLRVDPALFSGRFNPDEPESFAHLLKIEVIEPTRGIAILNPSDYRQLDGYVIRVTRVLNEVESGWGRGSAGQFLRRLGGSRSRRRVGTMTEIFSDTHRQLYEDDRLIDETLNRATPGVTPIVHIQNISQPMRYAGLSEVEPLIPLQNELNTRLSDRATRVTMQCFKMYLAKGIEGFDKSPIGPGALWQTDNPDASIEAFGGDTSNPSEESHINEVREAMDKVSGVPPLAAGVVRAKIGNLSSANALRVTLLGLLSKTARKRVTYGSGMAQMCRLILTALDEAGVLDTTPTQRSTRIVWPDPVPADVHEQTLAAKAKRDLGVPDETILAELGYGPTDAGVT
ncbi:phage portal protein [Roseiflexus sp. AH-315-K22]|nr:phage portal protein [Roseiflexus sp. AH-315-K22]